MALAQRVQELSRYRSEFFGRLRAILGNRPDIRIVGDRFVFQSEVFFDTGQAMLLPEGRPELDTLGGRADRARQEDPERRSPGCCASTAIPTCVRSPARASSRTGTCPRPARSRWCSIWSRTGVPPQRLVAAGFGEFQPLDTGNTEEAYKRNRRIELKLTER